MQRKDGGEIENLRWRLIEGTEEVPDFGWSGCGRLEGAASNESAYSYGKFLIAEVKGDALTGWESDDVH